jgi:hypothetical protein
MPISAIVWIVDLSRDAQSFELDYSVRGTKDNPPDRSTAWSSFETAP